MLIRCGAMPCGRRSAMRVGNRRPARRFDRAGQALEGATAIARTGKVTTI